MPEILRSLFPLILMVSSLCKGVAQNPSTQDFDGLVTTAIDLSEQALFEAKFGEALAYLDTLYFGKFDSFEADLQVQVCLQRQRVSGFRNLLFQVKNNREETLAELLSYKPYENTFESSVKASYFLSLSSAYRSVGKLDASKHFGEKAMTMYTELKDLKKISEIRANEISRRHNALLREGKKQEILAMIPAYKEEIAFSTEHSKYALAYNTRHLGQIHRRQTGDLEEALSLFQQSLELRKEIGFKPFIPASYSSVGDVYLAMKNYEKSIEAYQKSSELAEEIGFTRYQLYPNMQIGNIYFEQRDKAKAKIFFQKALDNARQNNHEQGMLEAKRKLELLR
ncbi:MAG: tetratricopeptide repeat protein [Cyclobacteriaceae bacterium]